MLYYYRVVNTKVTTYLTKMRQQPRELDRQGLCLKGPHWHLRPTYILHNFKSFVSCQCNHNTMQTKMAQRANNCINKLSPLSHSWPIVVITENFLVHTTCGCAYEITPCIVYSLPVSWHWMIHYFEYWMQFSIVLFVIFYLINWFRSFFCLIFFLMIRF